MKNLTPLDGRYGSKLSGLINLIGEAALTQNRVRAEAEYFISLSAAGLFNLTEAEQKILRNLVPLSEADLQIINDIEFKGYKDIKPTNHDLKAVEYFMRDRLSQTTLADRLHWLHFALTSEDINSLAYALMLRDCLEQAFIPLITQVQQNLLKMAKKHASSIMLARTHGQPAVPTTFGKEIRVFEYRLLRQLEQLKKQKVSCKFSGAVGNYNAHYAAFDNIDWFKFSQNFINGFNKNHDTKLFLSEVATQVDSRDSYIEIFDNLRRANMVLTDLCQDMWRYISDGVLSQKAVEGEVGSSTMPQKINPIDFENAEGNLGLANALYGHFALKLPVSRLQRDLSDSTVLRNIATAFGYNVIALKSLQKGLTKTDVDEEKMMFHLERHPEVLAEAVQTILRAYAVPNPYEKIRDLTRGKKITAEGLAALIEALDVPAQVKERLKKLASKKYTGIAANLARKV